MRRVSAGRGNPELVEQAERQETPEAALASTGQSNDILSERRRKRLYALWFNDQMHAERNVKYSQLFIESFPQKVSNAHNVTNEFMTFHIEKKRKYFENENLLILIKNYIVRMPYTKLLSQ